MPQQPRPDANGRPTKAKLLTPVRSDDVFVLHPITLDPYRVPKEALVYDQRLPVPLDYGAFEDLAVRGGLGAERCLNASLTRGEEFQPDQVVCVKLRRSVRQSGKCHDSYTWGNYMSVVLPEAVVGNDPEDFRRTFSRFLMLWSPGKAFNAYLTRYDERRWSEAFVPHAIDEFRPDPRYAPAIPGLQIGPDDIEGAERVPPELLTPEERIAIAHIKPQQSLFARRLVQDNDWIEAGNRIVDRVQEKSRDRQILENESWMPASARIHADPANPATVPAAAVPGDKPDAKRARVHRHRQQHHRVMALPKLVASASYLKTNHGRGKLDALGDVYDANVLRTRVPRSLCQGDACHNPALNAFFAVHDAAPKPACTRWSALPGDVLGTVLGHVLANAMASNTNTALKQYQTLLLVSKDVNVFATRFLGAQLAEAERAALELEEHQADCLLADAQRPGFEPPAVAGRRARMLGIRMRDLMVLARADYRAIMPVASPMAPWANVPVLHDMAFHALAYFGMRESCEESFRAPLNKMASCQPALRREAGFSAMARTLVGALAKLDDFTWQKFPRREVGAEHDRALGLGGEDEGEAIVEMLEHAGAAGGARPEHPLLLLRGGEAPQLAPALATK